MRTALLTAALLLIATPALAQSAPPPVAYYDPYYYPPPAKPKREWYGWQTLATDGAAFMMVYGASQSRGRDGAPLAYGALATYSLGAPIVHLAHNKPGSAFGSAALRSLPAIAIFGETRSFDFALLAILSVPAAIAIDAAALAREDEPAPPKGFAIAPTAGGSKTHAFVGLSGIF